MKKSIKTAILLLAALLTGALSAGAAEITLESAAELALGNNRTLMARYASQRTLTRDKNSVWNEFFPDIYAGAALSRVNTIPVYAFPDATGNWGVGVSLGASIELSAGTAYRMSQARKAWEQGLIGVEELEHAVVRDARKGFLGLLLLRDVIGIYENMVTTAEARYERAKRRFEIGDARKLDMLSFQVAWQNMIPQLTNLRNAYAVSELEFRRLLGLPEDELLLLSGEIVATEETWDAETLIASRLDRRYDVRSARMTLEQLKAEKGLRVSEGLTPRLFVEYDFTPILFDPSNDPNADWTDYSGGLTMGMVLPIDGFVPNTKKSLAVKQVSDRMDAAEELLADSLQGGAIAIRSAVLNLNKSAAALRSLELNVVLAEESYDLVSRSYDVGEADYLQVQTSDDELNTARIQLVNEKFNYASSLEDLDYAIAREVEVEPVKFGAPVEPDTGSTEAPAAETAE